MGTLVPRGIVEELNAVVSHVGIHLQFRKFDLEYRYGTRGGFIFTREDLPDKEVTVRGDAYNSKIIVEVEDYGKSTALVDFSYFTTPHEIAKCIVQRFVISPSEAEPDFSILV